LLYKLSVLKSGKFKHQWFYLCNDGHLISGSYETNSDVQSTELNLEVQQSIKEEAKVRGWVPRST